MVCKHVVDITTHAHERWVERVLDPKTYAHLGTCKVAGCVECARLRSVRDMVLVNFGSRIGRDIAGCYKEAIAANRRVTDPDFLRAVQKKFGRTDQTDFLLTPNYKIVLVVGNWTDPPTLMSIYTSDMIEGTMLRNLSGRELKPVMNRWKFEARQRKG
jgi:hypothetical protein